MKSPSIERFGPLDQITAAILAGGLGTRLREIIDDRPKPLAPIHGRPFLAYLLDQIADTGVRHVVLCTGYQGEMVKRDIGVSHGPMRISYSQEKRLLGTGGALRLALPKINTRTVLVLNGDSFCPFDFLAFLNWHKAQDARASLLLAEVEDTTRYGQVKSDTTGRVLRFAEKKEPGRGPGWVNAGVYLIERGIIDSIPTGQASSLESEVFPNLVGKGLYGFRSGGRLLDIGTPNSYKAAKAFLGPTG